MANDGEKMIIPTMIPKPLWISAGRTMRGTR